MITFDVAGAYRPCTVCNAPIVVPFPPAWTIELIKEGPEHGPVLSLFTPHAEQCNAPPADPQPGRAIRLAGRFVNEVSIDPGLSEGPNRLDPPIWANITDNTRSFTSVGRIVEGQAVQIVDGAFVKPVIGYDTDGVVGVGVHEGRLFYAPLTGGPLTEIGTVDSGESFEATVEDQP